MIRKHKDNLEDIGVAGVILFIIVGMVLASAPPPTKESVLAWIHLLVLYLWGLAALSIPFGAALYYFVKGCESLDRKISKRRKQ